jgi:hypothetical protein
MNRFETHIARLPFTEKPDLMEMLWADRAGNKKNLESPVWHKAIISARRMGGA